MLVTKKSETSTPHGVVYSIGYDHHVQHLLTLLAQAAGDEMRISLRRVDAAVAQTSMTRIQALSAEIARLEAIK